MHRKRKRKKTILKIFLLIIFIGLFSIYFISNDSINTIEKRENNETEKKEYKKIYNKNDIFYKYYSKADKILDKMSIEEKIGQLFLVRYNKNDTTYLSNFYPGGYILFAKDFENHTKESIKEELDALQKMNKYKLIIGVDEEGGFVTRVSRYKNFREEKFLSPKFYYEKGGYELLKETEKEKATLLKSIGINLNLAPVADISTDENDFIYNRSFGYDEIKTSEFIKNMVTYANENEINSCLKHFPGYGNNKDTHTGIAIDNREYKNFLEIDYLPFIAGIKAKVPSILISHNIINCLDSTKPASLSKKVISELREKLNFTGIIITDDLAMDAVEEYVENNQAATLAIEAGNDMIITSDFVKMYKELLNSVNNKTINEEIINQAVRRILAWKYYTKLL